jgi:hypothetical protein
VRKSPWANDLALTFLFALAIILGSTLGSQIFAHLPVIPIFSNPREITSPLTNLNFAPVNNVLRFALYMLCPLLIHFALWPIRKRFPASAEWEEENENWGEAWKLTQGFLLFLGFTIYAIAIFPDSRVMDGHWFFHEGEWLAPAWKWTATGQLWTGSFFAHGAFYDALSSALGWKIFGVVNIPASRIITSFFERSTFLPAMAFVASTAHYTYAGNRRYSAAIFSALFVASVFFFTLDEWQHFERRDLPALLSLIFFLGALCAGKAANFFLAGFTLACAWLYSIDRGVYITLAEGSTFLAVAVLTRSWRAYLRPLLWFLLGFFTLILVAGIWLGFHELAEGVRTTISMFLIKDLSDGNIYPIPAFPITNVKFLRTQHTLPLVCLAVQLLAFFSFLRRENWRPAKNPAWIVQLLLLTAAFAYFRGALSRSDGPHYLYVSSFALLGAALVVARGICDSSIWQAKPVRVVLCLAALAYPAKIAIGNVPPILSYLPQYPAKMRQFLQAGDRPILQDWQVDTAAFLAKEFKDEKCFYSIVSEPLWIYLLRKPSCGKFHLTWLISDKGLQLEALEELKQFNPGKILVHTPRSGDKMDGIPIEKRVPYLYGYIEEHYRPFHSFKGWEVWSRK